MWCVLCSVVFCVLCFFLTRGLGEPDEWIFFLFYFQISMKGMPPAADFFKKI